MDMHARLQLPGRSSAFCMFCCACALLSARAAAQPSGSAQGAAPSPDGNAEVGAGEPASKPAKGASERPRPVDTANVVRANLESSYVAYPIAISGLPRTVFECNLAPHFFVNLPSWPLALVLTPKVVLRMFNEHSAPVRSPSFMPRIELYLWLEKQVVDHPVFYSSVTLSHHSNGQAGPFLGPDGQNNHVDGSFSTNFLEFSAYATGFRGRFFGWSSLSLQWHPGFNQDPELRGRYGLLRLNFATMLLADLPLHGQINLRVSAILDRFQRASHNTGVRELERFPIAISYSMAVPGIDLGVYASYYFGHDYYNIWFDNLLHTFQIGIAGGFAPTLLQTQD